MMCSRDVNTTLTIATMPSLFAGQCLTFPCCTCSLWIILCPRNQDSCCSDDLRPRSFAACVRAVVRREIGCSPLRDSIFFCLTRVVVERYPELGAWDAYGRMTKSIQR